LKEELRHRFLARFVETTQGRLVRARSLIEGGDAQMLARELHAMAGEAMMLELGTIADSARRGESAAKAWSAAANGASPGAEDPRGVCASCLDNVGHALAELQQGAP
jgi:HPt (histidine-containing phosphotransfer) domain-containing protein